MKLSEFKAKRLAVHTGGPGRLNGPRGEYFYSQAVAADVAAAEAAGVVWEPEEEALPERVDVYLRAGLAVMGPELGPMPAKVQEAVAFECKRRYNAWPELEKLAHSMGPGYGLCGGCAIFYDKLERILRGER